MPQGRNLSPRCDQKLVQSRYLNRPRGCFFAYGHLSKTSVKNPHRFRWFDKTCRSVNDRVSTFRKIDKLQKENAQDNHSEIKTLRGLFGLTVISESFVLLLGKVMVSVL